MPYGTHVRVRLRLKSWFYCAQNIARTPNAYIYYWCLGVTLLWRMSLELINQVLVPIMTPGPENTIGAVAMKAGEHGLSRWLTNWDGAWYETISQHGYVIVNHFRSYESIVFFPLFPYLVRWFSEATHISTGRIGLTINIFFTSLLAFFVFQFTKLIGEQRREGIGDSIGKLAVVLLLLSPSAFFFAAYYAEALLVLLVTSSLYFAYKDKFLIAAILAGLATATKSIGCILVPSLLIFYWWRYGGDGFLAMVKRKWTEIVAIAGLGLSGILAYMLYLWMRFGDPLVFIKTEKYWNRNVTGFFLKNIWQIWYEKIFSTHYFAPSSNYLYSLYLMVIPPAIVIFAIYLVARHRWQYAWLAVMCVLGILVPLSTGTLLSLNRYMLVLTPAISYVCVYIYPQSIWTKRLVITVAYFSAVTMFIFTAAFLSFRFAG